MLEVKQGFKGCKQEFPLLARTIKNKPIYYLDSAATTQKPNVVINALSDFYRQENANVHRGVYTLSELATFKYENARAVIQKHINAASKKEIIFTKGTTEAINLVAFSYSRNFLQKGDEILIGSHEHHSNIVPWQLIAKEKGLTIKVIPLLEDGNLDIESYKNLLTKKVKLVAVAHVSNVLGIINPVQIITHRVHTSLK